MLNTIAMWGGIAGIFVSIFAIIILFLTRKNILDILEKDVILFDENFETKKQTLEGSMKLTDDILKFGERIKLEPNFQEKAKAFYNSLVCVASNVKLIDEFYNIALDNNETIDDVRIANFKLLCRKDIGLSIKKSKVVKRFTTNNDKTTIGEHETILKTSTISPSSQSSFNASTSAFASMPQPKINKTKKDI